MSDIFTMIFVISGVLVIVLYLYRSIARTKSSVRWLKGYNLNSTVSGDTLLELLNRVKYPQKEEVTSDENGAITFKTKLFEYPVKTSQDENGNTVVEFQVQWSKVRKYKRKKVAMDLDNVYQFLKQEIEGTTSIDAMKQYEKNVKLQKAINIVSIALVVSFLAIMIFS